MKRTKEISPPLLHTHVAVHTRSHTRLCAVPGRDVLFDRWGRETNFRQRDAGVLSIEELRRARLQLVEIPRPPRAKKGQG